MRLLLKTVGLRWSVHELRRCTDAIRRRSFHTKLEHSTDDAPDYPSRPRLESQSTQAPIVLLGYCSIPQFSLMQRGAKPLSGTRLQTHRTFRMRGSTPALSVTSPRRTTLSDLGNLSHIHLRGHRENLRCVVELPEEGKDIAHAFLNLCPVSRRGRRRDAGNIFANG